MRNYLQHGRRHTPLGSDPIPGAAEVTTAIADRTASYVEFGRSFTAVAASTTTTFDLSTTATVKTNEASASPGSSWTGTNFAYDTGDPNYIHILTTGVYVYHASLFLNNSGTTTPSGQFSAAIEETGSLFVEGAGTPPFTSGYFDPGFAVTGMDPELNLTLDRNKLYYLDAVSPSPPWQRGLTFAHNNPGALDIGVWLFVARIAVVA